MGLRSGPALPHPLSVSLYGVLLFVHVSSAAVWFGGSVMFQVLAGRAARSDDPGRISSLLREAEFLGKRYFGPATGVTFLAGLWLVFEGGWGFGRVFVLGGLAGVVLSTVLGFTLIEPVAKKVTAALTRNAIITDEISSGLKRIRNVSWIDLFILLTVLFLMTVKPGS
jgi:uncharacterized membrane protein